MYCTPVKDRCVPPTITLSTQGEIRHGRTEGYSGGGGGNPFEAVEDDNQRISAQIIIVDKPTIRGAGTIGDTSAQGEGVTG